MKVKGFGMKRLGLFAAMALAAVALAGCATSLGTSPKGLEIPIERAAVKFSADVRDGGYRIVTTEELKKWLDDGKEMTILSSLTMNEDRLLGILPGAVSAATPKSEKELAPEDKERVLHAAGNNKERTLVVYGGFVACRRSHNAAKTLVENGYKNVYRYPAGIAGWGEAGYSQGK